MRFSRQEYWSGLPCPAPGDLSDPGIKPTSLMSVALAGGFFTISANWEALSMYKSILFCVSWPVFCVSRVPSAALGQSGGFLATILAAE